MAFNSYSRNNLDIESVLAAIQKNMSNESIDLMPTVETIEGIDPDLIKVKYQHKKLGRRIAPRYALKLDVLIISKSRSFKAHTINVSESGILLDRPLPELLQHEKFELVLSHVDENNQKTQLLFQAQSADPVGQPVLRIELLKSINHSSQRLIDLIQKHKPVEI